MRVSLVTCAVMGVALGGCKSAKKTDGDKAGAAPAAAPAPAAAAAPAPAAAAAPAPAPGGEPAPTAPDLTGSDNDEAAAAAAGPGVGPDACKTVVGHLVDVVTANPSPNVKADPDTWLADCVNKHATASHVACLMNATTIPDTAACDRAEFAGVDVPTDVVRELGPEDHPPDGSHDGDFRVFRQTGGRTCGFLYRERNWASAMFVMCGGAIISSPLTSSQDIDEVTALLANQQRQEHEIVKSIMDNYPYGRATHVYDQNGVYQGVHY